MTHSARPLSTPIVRGLATDEWPVLRALRLATLEHLPDAAHPEIVGMWVAGHARGTGVADALVDACLHEARARGATRVVLHVMETNSRARGCYVRHGFAPTGDRGHLPGALQLAAWLS